MPFWNRNLESKGVAGNISPRSKRNKSGQINELWNFNTTPYIEYLVIAGGGGGSHGNSSAFGGSGGAGGYISAVPGENTGGGAAALGRRYVYRGQGADIVVGAGGPAATAATQNIRGTQGDASAIGGIAFATGGGFGAGTGTTQPAGTGGSGGGGALGNTTGANGTTNQGYKGGNYNTGGQRGPGGGAGGAGSDTADTGGAGVTSSITGSSVTRAVGGGSTTSNTANTGNGGYGGRPTAVGGPISTAGNSGIIIIRYPAYYDDLRTIGAGLTYTLTISAGYKIYTFTAGNDTITI